MKQHHEFKIRQNLYKDVFQDGQPVSSKIYKRNVTTRITIYLSEIVGVEEVIGANAKVLKGTCKLHLLNRGDLTVNESYNTTRDMVFNYQKNIGFNTNKR
jgi:hypothetical protein